MSNPRGTLLTFLPLGPVTSNSYPKAQEARPAAVEGAAHKRRTSSLSSDGQSPAGFRILKVAPVHFGEHGGDCQQDWTLSSSPSSAVAALAFLPLGPVTSASYPKSQEARPAAADATAAQKRRTSSLSSFKVLKVAPVHYGAHGGDHQEDWHDVPEVAVEE